MEIIEIKAEKLKKEGKLDIVDVMVRPQDGELDNCYDIMKIVVYNTNGYILFF